MRDPPRVVNIDSAAKMERVLLSGLSRVGVNQIVSSCNRLKQRSTIPE
jgi:hypothetical protein